MVLLVIDTQKGITDNRLFAFETFEQNVKTLIEHARNHQVEVIYVQHDDGVGSGFSIGDEEFEIYDAFQPLENERTFIKKVYSAFHESVGLLQYLKEKNEKDIIIVGLQTDYCIDTSIKCGFEHGFHIYVPEYSNSSFDNEYMTKEETYRYFNEIIWPSQLAKCISIDETLKLIEKNG